MAVDNVFTIQRVLSQLQAVPIVGALCVSPLKAVVSLAESVTGLAVGIFCSIGAAFTNDKSMEKMAERGFIHVSLGVGSLWYSIINFMTLGFFGCMLEIDTCLSGRNAVVIVLV